MITPSEVHANTDIQLIHKNGKVVRLTGDVEAYLQRIQW